MGTRERLGWAVSCAADGRMKPPPPRAPMAVEGSCQLSSHQSLARALGWKHRPGQELALINWEGSVLTKPIP